MHYYFCYRYIYLGYGIFNTCTTQSTLSLLSCLSQQHNSISFCDARHFEVNFRRTPLFFFLLFFIYFFDRKFSSGVRKQFVNAFDSFIWLTIIYSLVWSFKILSGLEVSIWIIWNQTLFFYIQNISNLLDTCWYTNSMSIHGAQWSQLWNFRTDDYPVCVLLVNAIEQKTLLRAVNMTRPSKW